MTRNPWFRMYSEAIDDEKLLLLAFEDRWHFVTLLCCKNKGILDEGPLDLIWRKVAVKAGLDLRSLEEVARRLSEVGLIDQKTLQPLAWESRQFQSDSSRLRVAAFRERKKNNDLHIENVTTEELKQSCNVTVTVQETDTDTDTELKDLGRQGDRNQAKRFEEFWKAYPRKVKKPKVFDLWKRRNLDERADDIIADVEARKRSDPEWLESTRLIPHPTSYLNAERWTDEWRGPVKLVHSSPDQSRESFIQACVRDSHMDPSAAAEYADDRFKRLGRYFR